MGEIQVPAFYVVNRLLKKEEAGPILQVLAITPVSSAIIHNILDADLALAFSPQVLRCATEEDSYRVALKFSQDSKMPVLVIGTAEVIDAVYSDGRRVKVVCDA
jgi:hypothetical protein